MHKQQAIKHSYFSKSKNSIILAPTKTIYTQDICMSKLNYALLSATLIFSTLLPKQTILDEVRAGNTQAIKERIKNCENCSDTDENGNNALHIAAEEGKEEHQEIIDMLTTEPDYSSWNNWFYGFFYAPTLPNKNEKNKNGKVPLRCAMERGNIGTSEKLIIKGANPHITDTEGISPVFSVVKENKPELIPLLVKHQLIKQKLNGQNMLHCAINFNQLAMVEGLATDTSLTQEEDNEGRIPAMLAAEKEDASCLRILHVKGVNLNARNRFGQQPIHSSARSGSYEPAKYLLEHASADVDSTDNNDNTPLLLSGAHGRKNLIDLFVAYKADTKKRNKQGMDVLDLATKNRQYHLIERLSHIPGININAQDTEGKTKFMRSTEQQDYSMMRILSDCGADLYITDNKGETALHKVARNGDINGLAQLKETHIKYWNQANYEGNSPAFVAAENGHFKAITMFMNAGASLEGTNNAGETIFHQIAKSKKPSMFTAIMKGYKPQTNINTQSKSGFSPIHYASSYNDVEMMRAFAEHGASYTDITPHGDTLAHTAAKSGALDSLKELKYRMPMMLQQRNKNNHTPFISAAAQGNLDATDFLLCEEWIINRDISIAINSAHQNKHTHVVRFLKKKEEDRMDACIILSNQPQAIINTEKDIQYLHQQLVGKNGWHFINVAFYQPSSPNQYSANELYYMTQAQRTQIALEYKKLYKNAREKKKELKRELDRLIAQEQEEARKEHERIRQARKAEKQREKEALIAQMRAQEAAQKQAEEERIRAEQQKEFDHYAQNKQKENAINAQDEALKKHNEQKKKEDDLIAGQQTILDDCAAKKALTDAAKHNAALDKQQEYVQPSAPPMEQKVVAQQCASCGGKAPSKLIPCVKCKKKIEGACPTCVKQYTGRCPHCYELHTLGIEKQKGECCIGVAACTEEKGVTVIPCAQCKKESCSDRICAGCLQACINDNGKKGQKDKCPRCTQNTLNADLAEKILSQQK